MDKEKDGVWRTIRGRRIFIAKGESLGQAMAKSGKFNRSDIRENREIARDEMASKKSEKYSGKKIKYSQLKSLDKEKYNKYDRKYQKEQNKIEKSKPDIYANRDNQAQKNRINENARSKNSSQRTIKNYYKYSDEDRRQIRHEELQKKLADFKAKKQSNNKIDDNVDVSQRVKDNKIVASYGKNVIYQNDKGNWVQSRENYNNYVNGKIDKLGGELVLNEKQGMETLAHRDVMDKVGYEDYLKGKGQDIYEENIKKMSKSIGYDQSKYNYGFEEKQSNDKIKEDIRQIGDTDINSLRSLAKKVKDKQSNNKQEMIGDIPKKSYDIADKINKDFEGKDRISRDDFDSYRNYDYDDEDADIRGIMSYDGWETLYESDDRGDEGDLVRDLPKTSKAKKDENDWLPKATEIKEQGTSNRKQVSDNIQAHILEHYGPDYTGDDSISAEQAFVEQMDAMSWLPNNWKRGEEIAKGGSYLVYNQDMADFLDTLKINPKGKKFDSNKSFDTYVSLIGRESAKLYDKIKKHQAETINNYKKRKGK